MRALYLPLALITAASTLLTSSPTFAQTQLWPMIGCNPQHTSWSDSREYFYTINPDGPLRASPMASAVQQRLHRMET